MLRHILCAAGAAIVFTFALPARAADKDGFADTFDVKPADLVSTGRNDFFILEPGYQLVMEGKDGGKPARLVITVLDETRNVDGVETRVVEEHESVGGKVVEISRNFFAVDKNTNDVYYFGEDVDNYKDGKVDNHGGAWLSGANGAKFGLAMPAKPVVGQKYYQEIAPKEAMDRAEVKSVTEKVKVPAGAFENCLKTEETTPLEPDERETKLYGKGVGQLRDGPMRLVKYGMNIEKRADRGAADHAAAEAAKVAKAEAPVEGMTPVVPLKLARAALDLVGADPTADAIWLEAINDPALTESQRSDLIEDLNENGFPNPSNVTHDDLPLVLSRMDLIEQLAPDAMDDVNAAAFAEAYKDLTNMVEKLAGP